MGALRFTVSFKYKAYESFARNMPLFDGQPTLTCMRKILKPKVKTAKLVAAKSRPAMKQEMFRKK